MKKIAVINDLSGMGKCSLTAALPVISVMGVQACPLPTAILSAQTGFETYYYDDYTEHMEEIMLRWKQMGFCPDGIYTGFLSGAAQAEKILEFIDLFGQNGVKILTDPVMETMERNIRFIQMPFAKKCVFWQKKRRSSLRT